MASSRARLMYFTDLLLYSIVSGFTNNRSRISVTMAIKEIEHRTESSMAMKEIEHRTESSMAMKEIAWNRE